MEVGSSSESTNHLQHGTSPLGIQVSLAESGFEALTEGQEDGSGSHLKGHEVMAEKILLLEPLPHCNFLTNVVCSMPLPPLG